MVGKVKVNAEESSNSIFRISEVNIITGIISLMLFSYILGLSTIGIYSGITGNSINEGDANFQELKEKILFRIEESKRRINIMNAKIQVNKELFEGEKVLFKESTESLKQNLESFQDTVRKSRNKEGMDMNAFSRKIRNFKIRNYTLSDSGEIDYKLTEFKFFDRDRFNYTIERNIFMGHQTELRDLLFNFRERIMRSRYDRNEENSNLSNEDRLRNNILEKIDETIVNLNNKKIGVENNPKLSSNTIDSISDEISQLISKLEEFRNRVKNADEVSELNDVNSEIVSYLTDNSLDLKEEINKAIKKVSENVLMDIDLLKDKSSNLLNTFESRCTNGGSFKEEVKNLINDLDNEKSKLSSSIESDNVVDMGKQVRKITNIGERIVDNLKKTNSVC